MRQQLLPPQLPEDRRLRRRRQHAARRLVELAFATPQDNFTFAYISDSHIQHIRATKFVNNWDRGLIRAVAETNLITPKPDFVMFGGDLAQLGTKASSTTAPGCSPSSMRRSRR